MGAELHNLTGAMIGIPLAGHSLPVLRPTIPFSLPSDYHIRTRIYPNNPNNHRRQRQQQHHHPLPPRSATSKPNSTTPREEWVSKRQQQQQRGPGMGVEAGMGMRDGDVVKVFPHESSRRGHPSSLGWPYTPSLPDDSSAGNPDPDADPDTLRKDSVNELCLICLKDAGGGGDSDNVHQLDTPESSVHRVLVPWTKTSNNSPVTPELDSLASLVGCEGEWE
ncbi:hypothetical protein PILCRDRAFT_7135 [Piloderma croceum F 1598]|uniref:Uncharacterized protein n=1 Tax=Piloderma croceum (strain F 1598) TaxID=765440 RepID=A0A0C3FHA1_PILCF|nr:hypothetical protein PILCRDRAFT_7135 [Piloderma croceum F 1598]